MLALHKASRAGDAHWALTVSEVLHQKSILERFELLRGDFTHLVANEIDFFLRYMYHLTNHRVKQAGFTATNFANYDNKLALFNLEIDILNVENVVECTRLQRNVKHLLFFRQDLLEPLADSCLRLLESLLLLLLGLLLEFVFLLLVEKRDAPAIVSLHC